RPTPHSARRVSGPCMWPGRLGLAPLSPPARESLPPPSARTSASPTPMRRVRRSAGRLLPPTEVLEVPARGGTALALVLGPHSLGPGGGVGSRRHAQEGDLADLHARIEGDREVGDVRELEGEVAVPAGVDEA